LDGASLDLGLVGDGEAELLLDLGQERELVIHGGHDRRACHPRRRYCRPVGARAPELAYRPTMPEIVRRAAREFGEADFVEMDDRRISFRQAELASRRLAKELLAAG